MTFEDKETDPSVRQLGLLNFIGDMEERENDCSSVQSDRDENNVADYNLFSDISGRDNISPPRHKGIMKKPKFYKSQVNF